MSEFQFSTAMDLKSLPMLSQSPHPSKANNKSTVKRCHTLPKRLILKSRDSKVLNPQKPRVFCSIPGCSSSFGRSAELMRHQKSIHGPKQQCEIGECKYATGRPDKMVEHVRKRHNDQNDLAAPSSSEEENIAGRGIEFSWPYDDVENMWWNDSLVGVVENQLSSSWCSVPSSNAVSSWSDGSDIGRWENADWEDWPYNLGYSWEELALN